MVRKISIYSGPFLYLTHENVFLRRTKPTWIRSFRFSANLKIP